METKVISVRVPAPFAKELANYCKQSNQSISEYVQKGFTNVGMMELDTIRVDPSTIDMLASIGVGSVVGILAYKGVYGTLKLKGYTDKDAEIYAVLAGVSSSILSGIGTHKLLKLFK
jgi:hypothetical protein